MRIKSSLIFLALGGLAFASTAAPSLQACNPMEVIHNGDRGLSYTMGCAAGGWKLSYSGSVPGGTEQVVAKYRLSVTGENGESFTRARQVRLPSSALLGQALLREAVLLDSGDLALRECEPVGCTLYRPLGAPGLTQATITGSQEIQRLKAETLRLGDLAAARGEELATLQSTLADRQAEVEALQGKVSRLSDTLTTTTQQSEAERLRLEAQLGTQATTRHEELVAAQGALTARQAEIATLQRDVARLTSELAASAQRFASERAGLEAQLGAAHEAARAGQAPAAEPAVSEGAPAPCGHQALTPHAVEDAALTDALTEASAELLRKHEAMAGVLKATQQKLDKAQGQVELAAARIDALQTTQQLTLQNLTIAHAELDATKHELARLQRERVGSSSSTALSDRDAVLGRVADALVNANVQIEQLKEALARAASSKLATKARPSQSRPH